MTERLEKVTLNLREGDKDFIQSLTPTTGYSLILRRLVSKFVDEQKSKLEGKEDNG